MLSHTDRPLTAASSAHPTGYGRGMGEVLAPETLRAVQREAEAAIDPCPTRAAEQIVCVEDSSCICPLSGHVTDAERAVMNDISRQASRLARTLALIFALLAVVATVLLLLR